MKRHRFYIFSYQLISNTFIQTTPIEVHPSVTNLSTVCGHPSGFLDLFTPQVSWTLIQRQVVKQWCAKELCKVDNMNFMLQTVHDVFSQVDIGYVAIMQDTVSV